MHGTFAMSKAAYFWKLNPRHALLMALIVLCLFISQREAMTRFHGGIAAGEGSVLTTMAIVNTSGSTQATNFVTQIFGHPFKKGDVANGCSGGAPQFQLVGGTNVPFSEGVNPVCWGDGSLEWAPFMLRVPTTIGGSYAISSGTYNSGTGAIVITTSSTPTGVTTGSTVNIDGLTGTGNWGALTGTYTVASVAGSNVTISGPTGMGTSAITGGTLYQAITVNILSGGSTPSASARSPSDLTASSHDPNVKVVGMSNLTGTYVSDLVKGISDANADNYKYMDGDAGRVDRIRECFRLTNTSGSCHGQLEGYFYIQELNDASANFGGARWMMRVAQPWYDVSGNNYRTFSAWSTYDNTTQLKNVFGTAMGVSRNFLWDNANGVFTSANYIRGAGFVIQVSNSGGSLPTGMSTNTDYWQHPNSYTQATWFDLYTGTSGSASQVSPSSTCTGTCSFTAYPYVVGFGSIFTANTDGSYDYFQGSGTVASDSHVRITFNNAYWKSTRMIPPYALGSVPTTPYSNIASGATGSGQAVNHVNTYYPDNLGPVDSNINTTGESDWIGPEPMWVASHVFLQDAADEQYIRTASLMAAAQPVMLLNSTTRTIPVVNNSTYSGMPAHDTTLFWGGNGGGAGTGFNNPANSNVYLGPYNVIDSSHMTEWDYYALLAFGNPEYEDNLLGWGSTDVLNHIGFPSDGTAQSAVVTSQVNAMGGINSNGSSERNLLINGTHRYGMMTEFGDLMRQEAWAVRTVAQARAMVNTGPSASSVHSYLTDVLADQFGGEADFIALLPAYAQSIGTFNEATSAAVGQSQSWTRGYHLMAMDYAYAINDSPSWGVLTLGNHVSKFWKFVHDTLGVWAIPSYNDTQRDYAQYNNPSAGSQDYGPYLTASKNYVICDAWTQSWTNGSATFTDTSFPSNYVENNGDTVRWYGPSSGNNVPTALSGFGVSGYFYTFYKVNVNNGAKSFELSSTLGGAHIVMTNSGSDAACEGPYGMLSSTITSISTAPGGSGYMQNETGALNWWKAVGGTVDSTTLTDMQNNLAAVSGYQANVPKYAFVSSF